MLVHSGSTLNIDDINKFSLVVQSIRIILMDLTIQWVIKTRRERQIVEEIDPNDNIWWSVDNNLLKVKMVQRDWFYTMDKRFL